jgi:hypothetical protein
MARIRLLAVSLVLIAICSPWAAGYSADDKSDKAPDTKMRGQLPQNWSKLGLSDKQKQDIYKVQNDFNTKMDALRKQLDDLKAAEKKELEKVLTPAQKERLKEILTGKAPDTSK